MHVQVHVYCLSRGIESIRRAVARRVCPAVSNVESIISRVKSTHRILALATSPQITLPATLSPNPPPKPSPKALQMCGRPLAAHQ